MEIASKQRGAGDGIHGYGGCSECGCTGFQGQGDLCSNCEHNYGSHG